MRFVLISKIATLTDCPPLLNYKPMPNLLTLSIFPLNKFRPQMCFRPFSLADEKMTEGRVFEVPNVNDLLDLSFQPRTSPIKTWRKLLTKAVID